MDDGEPLPPPPSTMTWCTPEGFRLAGQDPVMGPVYRENETHLNTTALNGEVMSKRGAPSSDGHTASFGGSVSQSVSQSVNRAQLFMGIAGSEGVTHRKEGIGPRSLCRFITCKP